MQLHDVLSAAAVLAVRKLVSCLPHCATPGVAKASCSVPLVGLLYTSTERITTETERELEIIAKQTASLCSLCWHLRLNPPCCGDLTRKRQQETFCQRPDLCLLLALSPGVVQTYLFQWRPVERQNSEAGRGEMKEQCVKETKADF